MIFGFAETISLLSTFMTLEAGDVLVMGTPAGIGLARKPPLFMKDGDVCEVEIEGLGILRNPIAAEWFAKWRHRLSDREVSPHIEINYNSRDSGPGSESDRTSVV